MYVSERPLTFTDLVHATQRSAGLGQATPICYDDAGNVVDCSSSAATTIETPYSIVETPATASTGIVTVQNQQGLQIGGTFVSLSTLGIGAALILGAALLFGGRR